MKSFNEYLEWGTKKMVDAYKKDTPGEKKEAVKKKKDDPCWKGYAQLGTKKGKDGKEVPNCVPIEEEVAANNVGSGMVDMNPTGLQRNDKRRKYQCDNMFRRANGLKVIEKMLKAKAELSADK